MVAHNVLLVRRKRSDRDLFDRMRELRERADYSEHSVDRDRLASCAAAVRAFVEEATR